MTKLIDETDGEPILVDDMVPGMFGKIVSAPIDDVENVDCGVFPSRVGDILYCDKHGCIIEIYPELEAYEDNKNNDDLPPKQLFVKVLSSVEVSVRIKGG